MSNYYYKKNFTSAAPAAAMDLPRVWQQQRAARNASRYNLHAGGTVDQVITLSNGNLKLQGNRNVQFLVWNIPAVVTCCNACGGCLNNCYAAKSEKGPRAASVLKCRYNNLNASLTPEFTPAMINHITDIITAKKAYKSAKKIVVRIHESGDFYSREYFNKWLEIAAYFENIEPRLVFVAYTKSIDFIPAARPSNMVIRFSVWDDTAPTDATKAAALALPIYTAVEHFTTEPAAQRCGCVDCGSCFKCFNNKFSILKCEIH